MPYLISVLAVAAGVVMLLPVLMRLSGSVHRLVETVRESRAQVAERTSALAARVAELRVAVHQRRHRAGDGSHPGAAA